MEVETGAQAGDRAGAYAGASRRLAGRLAGARSVFEISDIIDSQFSVYKALIYLFETYYSYFTCPD